MIVKWLRSCLMQVCRPIKNSSWKTKLSRLCKDIKVCRGNRRCSIYGLWPITSKATISMWRSTQANRDGIQFWTQLWSCKIRVKLNPNTNCLSLRQILRIVRSMKNNLISLQRWRTSKLRLKRAMSLILWGNCVRSTQVLLSWIQRSVCHLVIGW